MQPLQQIKLPTSPQTPPPTNKRLPLPKSLLVIIGGIVLCLIGLGSLYVLPAQQKKVVPIRLAQTTAPSPTIVTTLIPEPTKKLDPTANWKLYADKSISIKYPERFAVSQKQLPFNSNYPRIYSSIRFSDAISDITITIAKNSPNLSLDTALGNGPYVRYASTLIRGTKTVVIDGTDGKMAENIAAGGAGVRADILALAHGKVYEMTLSPASIDAEVFALMLSTMKILNQEPADITDDWPVHVDNSYKFSFRYPSEYLIDYNKVASGSPNLTMVYDNSKINLDAPKFKIEVQDIKNFGQSAVTSRAILQLPLSDYVDKKWEYNKNASDAAVPNRVIGPIKQTAVDGKTAYSFTVTGKYIDDHSQEILSGQYTFVFTEYNGYKYKIWFPTNDTIETQIFNTLLFL